MKSTYKVNSRVTFLQLSKYVSYLNQPRVDLQHNTLHVLPRGLVCARYISNYYYIDRQIDRLMDIQILIGRQIDEKRVGLQHNILHVLPRGLVCVRDRYISNYYYIDRQIDRWIERQIDSQIFCQIGRHTYEQTGKYTDRQIE